MHERREMNRTEEEENFADFTPDGIVLMWVQKILDDIQIPDGNLFLDRNSVEVKRVPEEDAEFVIFRIGGMATVNEQLTTELCNHFGNTDVVWYVDIATGHLMFMWLRGALMKWGYKHWRYQQANPGGSHANLRTREAFLRRLWHNGSIRGGLLLLFVSFVLFAVVLNDMQKPEVWHARDRFWAGTVGRVWNGLCRLAAKFWNAIAGDDPPFDPGQQGDATWMYPEDDGGGGGEGGASINGARISFKYEDCEYDFDPNGRCAHRRPKTRPPSPPSPTPTPVQIRGFKTQRTREEVVRVPHEDRVHGSTFKRVILRDDPQEAPYKTPYEQRRPRGRAM